MRCQNWLFQTICYRRSADFCLRVHAHTISRSVFLAIGAIGREWNEWNDPEQNHPTGLLGRIRVHSISHSLPAQIASFVHRSLYSACLPTADGLRLAHLLRNLPVSQGRGSPPRGSQCHVSSLPHVDGCEMDFATIHSRGMGCHKWRSPVELPPPQIST